MRKRSLPGTEEEVWRALEKRVGPLDPDVVAYLEEERWPEEVLQQAEEGPAAYRRAMEELERKYRRVLQLKAAPPRPSHRRKGPEDNTLEALARLLALEASHRGDVRAFRRNYLGGGTLSLAEAEKLLLEWSRQGQPTGEVLWVPTTNEEEEEPPEDWEWVLEFGVEADFRERRLPVTQGPLKELKALAAHLLGRYPWTEAACVALVVCGITPGVVGVRVRYVGGLHPLQLEAMPWVTAKDLATALQGFRADTSQLFRRYRMLTEKHLALALFAAEGEGRKWRELWEEWNATHPAWSYGRLSNFIRDATQAQRRLRSWASPGP